MKRTLFQYFNIMLTTNQSNENKSMIATVGLIIAIVMWIGIQLFFKNKRK